MIITAIRTRSLPPISTSGIDTWRETYRSDRSPPGCSGMATHCPRRPIARVDALLRRTPASGASALLRMHRLFTGWVVPTSCSSRPSMAWPWAAGSSWRWHVISSDGDWTRHLRRLAEALIAFSREAGDPAPDAGLGPARALQMMWKGRCSPRRRPPTWA